MLERILAGQSGVHDLIGEAQPGRPGWKINFYSRGAVLIGKVAFGPVMKAEHQLVIGAASAFCNSESREEPGDPPKGSAQRRQELLRKIRKRLAHVPNARLAGRVDIGEKAQNAAAPSRGRRKCVDMQERVVFQPRVLPASDFDRAIAGTGALEVRGIAREEIADEPGSRRRKVLHHRLKMQPLEICRASTTEGTGRGIEADVLRSSVR